MAVNLAFRQRVRHLRENYFGSVMGKDDGLAYGGTAMDRYIVRDDDGRTHGQVDIQELEILPATEGETLIQGHLFEPDDNDRRKALFVLAIFKGTHGSSFLYKSGNIPVGKELKFISADHSPEVEMKVCKIRVTGCLEPSLGENQKFRYSFRELED